jgi:hypothetical protein
LGYFVWKITILRQKILFFPILGGGGGAPGAPAIYTYVCILLRWIRIKNFHPVLFKSIFIKYWTRDSHESVLFSEKRLFNTYSCKGFSQVCNSCKTLFVFFCILNTVTVPKPGPGYPMAYYKISCSCSMRWGEVICWY